MLTFLEDVLHLNAELFLTIGFGHSYGFLLLTKHRFVPLSLQSFLLHFFEYFQTLLIFRFLMVDSLFHFLFEL